MSTSQLGQDEDGPPVRSAPEVHRSGFLCGHILDIAERSGSLLLHTPTPNNAETLAANKIVLSFTSAVMRSRYCRFTKCSAPHTHTRCFPACISYSPTCPCQWTWIRGPGSAWRAGSLMNTVSQRCTWEKKPKSVIYIIIFNKTFLSVITRPLRKMQLDLFKRGSGGLSSLTLDKKSVLWSVLCLKYCFYSNKFNGILRWYLF